MRPRSGLLTALVFIVLAAGCTDTGSFATVKGLEAVPQGAPSIIGRGDTSLLLRAVMETSNGTPVAKAAVAVYEQKDPIHPVAASVLRTQNTSMVGRTDENGQATLRLDAGRQYTVIVAGNATTIEQVTINVGRQPGPFVLRLFHSHLVLRIDGVADATPPQGTPVFRTAPPKWWPREARFHSDNGIQDEYVDKLDAFLTRMTYEPLGASGAGQLYLRLGFTSNYCRDTTLNGIGLPSPGAISRTISMPAQALRYGAHLEKSRLLVGPTTYDGVASPQGIPYSLEIDATFSSDPIPAIRSTYPCPTAA